MYKKRTSLFVLTLMLSAINVWSFSLVTVSNPYQGCTVLGDKHTFQSPNFIPYQIESGFLGGSNSYKNAVRRAFTTWDVDNAYLGYGESGSPCGSTSADGVCVKSKAAGGGYLAVTWNYFNGNTIVHSDIEFNTNHSWGVNPGGGVYDIERVAMHEIGHSMGLHHPDTCDNYGRNYSCSLSVVSATGAEVMNSGVGSGTQGHSLTQDEQCGSAYLYNNGSYNPPDNTPPAAVTNLSYAIISVVGNAATVRYSWTAPGDDGNSGRASSYDFRLQESTMINESNWSSSAKYSGEPSPKSAYSSETWDHTINFTNRPQIYVAMKTKDESGNISDISNAITVVLDNVPPDPITDLNVIDNELFSATLQWTATGNDGGVGTANSYDLRYSTSPITPVNFDSATQVSGEPLPKEAGFTEFFMINGLLSDTTYSFAIKAIDIAGNKSTISNVASITIDSDTDGDGLSDTDEAFYGTSSILSDTDGDGMGDLEEIIAGTEPDDDQSYSNMLYNEDFDAGLDPGDDWQETDTSSNIDWTLQNGNLVATVTGSSGYSFYAPFGKDFSPHTEIAISYDVTFEDGAKWGGFWFRGVYLDLNVYRVGWRDNNYSYVSSPIESNKKHHVLIIIHQEAPFYKSEVYIDGELVFIDESIEATYYRNDTLGFVSPYSNGNMNIDNFEVWYKPVMTPLNEAFDGNNLGVWKLSGNTNIDWSLNVGGLESKVLSSGYGYAEHALLDVDGKDILVKFNIGYYEGATWGGFLYRDVKLDLNPRRIGWRDDSYTYQSSTMTSNEQHEAVLIITENLLLPYPSLESILYVDGVQIPIDGVIEESAFTDNTVGFVSNHGVGEVIFDDFYIEVVDPGDNLAPVFVGLENQSILGGEDLSYQINALDAEASPLTFSSPDIAGLPGANLTTGGLLTWSPAIGDAGNYSLTVEVDDGTDTTTKVLQIAVNTTGVEAIIYNENFDSGLDPGDLWQPDPPSGNVTWSIVAGELEALVTGGSGYSFYAPTAQNFSTYTNLAIEYDVEFKDEAKWGGLWFRGKYLDLNLERIGWRDDSYTYVSSNLSADTKHHVIVFIRDLGGSYESDIYVNGEPIYINEPIQTSSFSNNTIGFVSPYYQGRMLLDNFKIFDFSLLSATPPTPLFMSEDFSSGDMSGWIFSGSTANTNWNVNNKSLLVSKTSSGGYSYLFPFALNVTDEDVNIEFDITYEDGADWGGLYYRGVYLDLNPTRVGWRDDSYTYENSPMVEGQTYHVKVTIDEFLYSEVFIDGSQVFQSEGHKTIESTSFSNNSVGFTSCYYRGRIIFDNFLIEEI